jgi:molybdopterin-binding protein
VGGPIVRTHLELDDPAGLRPAGPPRLAEVEIARVVPADGELSRWFYVEVGTPHRWTDNLARSDAEWQAWAERVETWVATVAGERAGYYELLPGSDGVEVAYFGLLPAFQGQGLGGHLLTHALRRGLELAPRVWLHTNTQDGAAALPNYLARGLRPFRREELTAGTLAGMKLSARNQLSGTVTRVSRGAAIANVELDVNGQRLVSSITVEAAEQLGLEEGKSVTAIIKASDVILATD